MEYLLENLELRDEIEQKVHEFAKNADTPILQFSADDDEDEDVEYQRMDGVHPNLDDDDEDVDDEA